MLHIHEFHLLRLFPVEVELPLCRIEAVCVAVLLADARAAVCSEPACEHVVKLVLCQPVVKFRFINESALFLQAAAAFREAFKRSHLNSGFLRKSSHCSRFSFLSLPGMGTAAVCPKPGGMILPSCPLLNQKLIPEGSGSVRIIHQNFSEDEHRESSVKQPPFMGLKLLAKADFPILLIHKN